MKFLIYNGNRYFKDNSGDPTWVDVAEKASKYKSRSNAEKVIQTRKLFFQGFVDRIVIVEYAESEDRQVTLPENGEELIDQMISAMSLLVNCTDDLLGVKAYACEELSRCDQIQQDILHKVKFTPMVGIASLRLMKMLRDTRLRRRKMKDAINLVDAFIDTGVIARMKKYQTNIETRTYTPRVLDELFKEEEK